jgi:hypothetical protein
VTSVPGWASPYIGLPFVDGGRDFYGVDCEGLCRLVMEHRAGNPSIPLYGVVSAEGLTKVAKAVGEFAAMPPWVAVGREALKPFDWVIMTGREKVDGRPRTLACHLGIMITEALVLHIEKATYSVAVPLDHVSIRHRLAGFVRHEALA